jgi:hypothetical protein
MARASGTSIPTPAFTKSERAADASFATAPATAAVPREQLSFGEFPSGDTAAAGSPSSGRSLVS